MNELRLSFVGTGNAFAPGGLCWNGFVLNERFLFEAPPQALQSLNRMGMNPNELDAVILSHHHGDHFLGLPFLLLHWKYFGRRRPVVVLGPPGTQELAMSIARSVYPGIDEMKFEVDWREIGPNEATTVNGLELQALPVKHDERLSATLGFTGALNGRRLAYTGDSAMCDAVLEMARHAEVLVTECASVSDRVPVHMNLVDDMPVLRAAMNPEAELVLTHIDTGMTIGGLSRARIAEDLATYRF